jgi:CCR4-NOT transcription complex subunit 6
MNTIQKDHTRIANSLKRIQHNARSTVLTHTNNTLIHRELAPPLWVAIKKMPLVGSVVEGILDTLTRPMEAPIYERKMITLNNAQPISGGFEFTTMTYNVLAECYVLASRYAHCPEYARRWTYRSNQIMKEITTYSPDVLFLQEVDHYRDFFEPNLARLGYKGLYTKRPGLRLDGCAVFYKVNKFDLVSSSFVEYNDLTRSNKFNATTRAHMKRDNVAIIATLQPKISGNNAKDSQNNNKNTEDSNQRVIVATTHFYWDPQFAFVKTEQAKMLLDRVREARNLPGSSNAAVIIGGDFNSVPDSDVYASFNTDNMNLHSAYSTLGEPETHFTSHYYGCLDYIWHTPENVHLKQVLQPVPAALCANKCEFPSPRFPSDHLPLMANYVLKSDRQT